MQIIKNIIVRLLISGFCLGIPSICFAVSPQLAQAEQLGFGHIAMPDNIAVDEFAVKALYFTLKEEAKKIKGLAINYDGEKKTPDDVRIEAFIEKYFLEATWFEPRADARDRVVWEDEQKWKDGKGKEHKMTTKYYESEIYDHLGQYSFLAIVRGTFNLVDVKSGAVLVQYSGSEYNDKEIDAYTSLVKKFYKQVNKEIKDSKKQYN